MVSRSIPECGVQPRTGTVSAFACGMSEALGYLTDHGVTPQFLEDIGLNYGSYTSDKDGNFYEVCCRMQRPLKKR